jgi:peptide/nickel transport system substrate-binding protein
MSSPTAMQSATTPEKQAKDHMIGTGAFRFESYQTDVNVIYEKVNNYWQKAKPYLDGIQLIQIQDPVTAVTYLKAGDAHLLHNISSKQARDLESAGFQIVHENLSPIGYITPDGANSDSPFADKRVREAAEYAIDKNDLVQGIGLGYYPVANQFALPGYSNYSSELAPRKYDPQKAKQLLAEAGYANGFKTTLYAPLSYNRDLLVVLQNYFKAVGIDASIDIADAARFTNISHNGWHNGIIANSVPVNSALASKISQFFNANLNVSTGAMASVYRPSGWQEKLDAALTQFNEEKRTEQTKELCKIMSTEAMAIPLWCAPQLSALDKRVHDLNWAQGHGMFWEPESAWISK